MHRIHHQRVHWELQSTRSFRFPEIRKWPTPDTNVEFAVLNS